MFLTKIIWFKHNDKSREYLECFESSDYLVVFEKDELLLLFIENYAFFSQILHSSLPTNSMPFLSLERKTKRQTHAHTLTKLNRNKK